MPKLASGVDAIFVDGKRYLPGDNVSLSNEKLDEMRAAGVVFEGDEQLHQVALVSTPEDPIPTDLAGYSVMPEHKDLVKLAQENNAKAAAAEAAALAAEEAAAKAAEKAAAQPAATPAAAGGSK